MKSQSVIKHSYVRAGPEAKGKAKAHINYIQHRSGPERDDKGPRQFFDQDNESVNAGWLKNKIDSSPNYGATMHKFIVSPGVHAVDLKHYTRALMNDIQERKGADLEWQAVIHENTDHPHAHVVMLGRDRQGKQVRFEKRDYEQMREFGDRYLDRRHEFDRFYDKSLTSLMKEGERGFDLDQFSRSDWAEAEKKELEKGGKPKRKMRGELHLAPRQQEPALRPPRKSRRQRLFESRGRKDVDYYHDLYQRTTARERLGQLMGSSPDQKETWAKQLQELEKFDEEHRRQFDPNEIDKILGIDPRDREAPKKTPVVEKEKAGDLPETSDELVTPEESVAGNDETYAPGADGDREQVILTGEEKEEDKSPDRILEADLAVEEPDKLFEPVLVEEEAQQEPQECQEDQSKDKAESMKLQDEMVQQDDLEPQIEQERERTRDSEEQDSSEE